VNAITTSATRATLALQLAYGDLGPQSSQNQESRERLSDGRFTDLSEGTTEKHIASDRKPFPGDSSDKKYNPHMMG